MTIEQRQPRVAGSSAMPLVVCSTGAISRGPDATDDQLIDRWCPEIDADAFEIMYYDPWYGRSDDIAARIRDLGLRCVGTHAEKSIGPNLVSDDTDARGQCFTHLAENCRFTRTIGASVLVLHLWGLPDGDAKLDQQLAALPRLIDIAEGEGVRLAIETIPCTVHTPLENLERVIAADARTRVVLDTEFLSMHGQLDAALDAASIWDDERVVHIHVKDFDGELEEEDGRRRYLHPGEGSIPFGRWFSEVAARGYRGPISLESTVVGRAGEVDIDRLNRSLARLRALVHNAWA
jgi:sugar phosphate isomerase/epimerase